MSPQMKEAAIRSGYQAVGQFLFAFLFTLQQGLDYEQALIFGGFAALLALGFRGGYEGYRDMRRAVNGEVIASDIQAPVDPFDGFN